MAPVARQGLNDLGSRAARRILASLNDRFAGLDNHRSIGGTYQGSGFGMILELPRRQPTAL